MAKARSAEKPQPLVAPVMSVVLGDMLGFCRVALLGLKGIKCLKDDV